MLYVYMYVILYKFCEIAAELVRSQYRVIEDQHCWIQCDPRIRICTFVETDLGLNVA